MDYFTNKHGLYRKPRRYDCYPSPDYGDHWSPPDYSHESADTFWARGKRYRHRNTCNTDNFDSGMPFSSGMPYPSEPSKYRRVHSYAQGRPAGYKPGSRSDVTYIDPDTHRDRRPARESRPRPRPQLREHSYERCRPATQSADPSLDSSTDEPEIIERAPKPHKQARFAEPSTPRARQTRSSSPVDERRPPCAGRRMPSGYSTGSGIPERARMPYSRGPACPRTSAGERQRRLYSITPFSPRMQVHERQRRMYSYTLEPTRETHRTETRASEMPDMIRDGYKSISRRARQTCYMGRYALGYDDNCPCTECRP